MALDYWPILAGLLLHAPSASLLGELSCGALGIDGYVPMPEQRSNNLLSIVEGLLDNAPFGMHVYRLLPDERLIFIGSNATAARLLAVDHEAFIGKTIQEAFPALTTTEVPARYMRVARSKEEWKSDQVDYDEQGIRGAFEVHAMPAGDDCMVAFFVEITQRLRVERELRRKQQELDTYFTHALDLLCIAGTDGRFKRLNPEWERVLGIPLSELIGTRFIDYVHPDDVERTVAAIEALAAQESVTNFVNRYRCRGGEYRSIEWRSFPYGQEIYAVARDITDQLGVMDRLRESEARYRSLVDAMSETVSLNEVLTNAEGEPEDYLVLDVNPAWERVFGISRQQIVGRRATDISGSSQPEFLSEFSAVAFGGAPVHLEVYNPRYQRHSSVSVTSPRRGQFVAVASDVTERVHVEQRLQRAMCDLTAKGQELESLLYVTTHDLRSPLVNIQGFSARIERALQELTNILEARANAPPCTPESILPIAERLSSSLDYIKTSAHKMDRLISGLLRLSRIGRQPLQSCEVDMATLWKQVLTVFSHQIKEASVEVRSGELPVCFGDAGQLDQVLSNLLDNAVKYRDPSRPCIVSFSGQLQEDGRVLYCLQDTSRGIAPEHVDRIWELFHRLAPHDDLPGDGIGLTAAKQIIARHNGEITVQSKPGVGSVFSFRLPGLPHNAQHRQVQS